VTVTVPPISAVLLTPVAPMGTNMLVSVSGNHLNLSWPSNYTGWLLQSNSAGLAATKAWFPMPCSSATNSARISINPNAANVFYRMVLP
jgi:hypothetical protein